MKVPVLLSRDQFDNQNGVPTEHLPPGSRRRRANGRDRSEGNSSETAVQEASLLKAPVKTGIEELRLPRKTKVPNESEREPTPLLKSTMISFLTGEFPVNSLRFTEEPRNGRKQMGFTSCLADRVDDVLPARLETVIGENSDTAKLRCLP